MISAKSPFLCTLVVTWAAGLRVGRRGWLHVVVRRQDARRLDDQGDGWNDLEITAKGMRIKSVLNGVTVVDYDGSDVLDDEVHKQHRVGTKGPIGLQIHANDELKLRFKDIRIKEL
jgi:hypothetical protein